MQLKLRLFCATLIQFSCYATKTTLPSFQEVKNTGHPLILALYADALSYQQKPVIPSTTTTAECLKFHKLLSSPWVHAKGFTKEIEKAHNRNEAVASIENNQNYKTIPELAQRVLKHNLLQAFEDCKDKGKSTIQ